MTQHDIYYIDERLKAYDPNLRVEWDSRKRVHRVIYHNDLVMIVPEGKLDARVYDRIRWIDRRNGFNPFQYVRNELDKRDRTQEKKVEHMAQDMADMLHRPLVENYLYGD
jgi:hypothetical protein